jgi:hypothetical protein
VVVVGAVVVVVLELDVVVGLPVETKIVTVDPLGTTEPAGGSVRVTEPAGVVADVSLAVRILNPAAPRVAPAEPASCPCTSGTWT